MNRFLDESEAHLAVSLHSPFDDERKEIMPIQSVYPITEVINELKRRNIGGQRRVSFEYIMFKGVNDTPRHANELARLLRGLKCRINLIGFHPIPDTPLKGTSNGKIKIFRIMRKAKGLTATLRPPPEQNTFAACG